MKRLTPEEYQELLTWKDWSLLGHREDCHIGKEYSAPGDQTIVKNYPMFIEKNYLQLYNCPISPALHAQITALGLEALRVYEMTKNILEMIV